MTKDNNSDQDLVIINNRAYKFSELGDDLKKLVINKLSTGGSYVKPSLSSIFSLKDFEKVAQNTLSTKTFAYYKTGAADELTLGENELAFQRIYFKPRILNSVSKVSIKTNVLGSFTNVPFYITAFAGAWMDDNIKGELPLATSAGKNGVIQMIPCLTKLKLQQLVDANSKTDQWLQIYLRDSYEDVLKLIKEAEQTNKIKALFFTVDVAQLGRRETEARIRNDSSFKRISKIASDLNWNDLQKIKSQTNLKIILKGVQTVEDAIKSIEYGFEGFVISNHGGRQLDTARSSIEILAEIVPELKKKNLYHKTEIFIDGGVRRGSDIVKAIALGAKSVGLGRPFLYALQTYGEEGIDRVLELLKEEVELTLRLLGVKDIHDLYESFVDTLDLFGNRFVK